ncbi:hypothetical protein TcCL_ESM03610 [Trypanosoma cruzi]|uniref:Uncharacterized protein n=1 Tax=Trypanosoma cruzi (strain CL Brener) TaxID=353153 RepID=Q4D2Z2_TRYCC|nr:hypothetical protein Tc00.1047053507757.10 [Trypanosoma cruzi]EAN86887.1 hypothetical protein Tc00.1047053507757.10 [Trypanosoma cruzi]RNC58780.1 hypothetical protein TcCL_ESM03610 [Trypanosoma cruzi]|eukprot:XP_808738.1 hypothetical protein [Trypanosoma cruzi strain CL Brener]
MAAGGELAATAAAVRGQFATCARGGRTTWRRMGFWRLSFSPRWMRASSPADVLSMGRRSCDRPVFWPQSQSAPCRRQKGAKSTQCHLSTKRFFLPCSGRGVPGGYCEQLRFCCWLWWRGGRRGRLN